MSYHNIIIGNSAASVGAIEAIRRLGCCQDICVVSEENNPPYSRPSIGDIICGKRNVEDLWYRPAEFYERNQVTFLGGKKAVRLETDSREVQLDDGDSIGFDDLLLATGGTPFIPPIPGLRSNALTFSGISDARVIREKIESGNISKVVILGGGLIGCSLAEPLLEIGLEVTIVELASRILSSVLDQPASNMVQLLFKDRGLNLITGHTLESVCSSGKGILAILDDGRRLSCELLVVAIGVRPRTDLAEDAGIQVDRGIMVNKSMSTNVPHIYAAGDCAQTFDFIEGQNRTLALWPAAYVEGMVAGYNMAGKRASSQWATSMNSMHFFGTSILSAGITEAREGGNWNQVCEEGDLNYSKFVTRNGKLVGFIRVGNIDNTGIYLQLMRNGTPLSDLHRPPTAEGFSLVDLPTACRRKILTEGDNVAEY